MRTSLNVGSIFQLSTPEVPTTISAITAEDPFQNTQSRVPELTQVHSWGFSSKHTKQSSKAHTSSHTPAGECRPPCYCLVSLLGFDSIWHVTCTRWHSYIITQHYTLFYITHHTLLGSYTIGHVWGTRPTRWHSMQTQYKGLIIQTRASGAFIILWAIKAINVIFNRFNRCVTLSYWRESIAAMALLIASLSGPILSM